MTESIIVHLHVWESDTDTEWMQGVDKVGKRQTQGLEKQYLWIVLYKIWSFMVFHLFLPGEKYPLASSCTETFSMLRT